MPQLRVFSRISRQMQRLGYFKYLIKKVSALNSSSIENLGSDLIETVSRKVPSPLTSELSTYIKIRLYDRVYATLKKQVDDWIKNGAQEPSPSVLVEIQDLYLADASLPSGAGKLVKNDFDIYPGFGINLGLIRAGTYSSTTRAFSLLSLTPDNEIKALSGYSPEINPLKLTQKQALLFLYSFLDNDGEVIAPLWNKLQGNNGFNDRFTGDLLPSIYQKLISRHQKHSLSIDFRERLAALKKSSESIAKQAGKIRYAGGTSREHASRPRMEPYVDMGIFIKPDRLRYEYEISSVGKVWLQEFGGDRSSEEIEAFIQSSFFNTAAIAGNISAEKLSAPSDIVPRFEKAWKLISSSNGYAPIEEIALLAGINCLFDEHQIMEISAAREAIIAYQKANPYSVRFTVDRMGNLAHAKFIDENIPPA